MRRVEGDAVKRERKKERKASSDFRLGIAWMVLIQMSAYQIDIVFYSVRVWRKVFYSSPAPLAVWDRYGWFNCVHMLFSHCYPKQKSPTAGNRN